MMTRTTILITLTVAALAASKAAAQTHDHFDRQRREAIARQEAARQHHGDHRTANGHFGASHHGHGHWGGPTTTRRWYPSTASHIHHQAIQFYPVNPFGYGIPAYGYYGISPYCRPAGHGIYIHRQIYHSR